MPRLFLFLLALALGPGSVDAATVELRLVQLEEQAIQVDVYLPASAPPRGLAVVAHGFTRSRERHRVLAGRLADAGFVVAVPDLPHWARPYANAEAIVAVVKALEVEPGRDELPVVLVGTSAGGLASLLATDRVPRLALWIGLDPVDALGLAEDTARRLQVSALVVRAPAGACNVGGSARRIAAWLPNRAEVRIAGASHCDFEDTTNWRCESVCGPADPGRQGLIVEEAVRAAREAVR
jgi:dienelactone hydrolase